MPDAFSSYADSPLGPSSAASAITPNDTNALSQPTKAIYVGTTGHVVLRPLNSTADVTYRNVPAGAYLTIRASHIRATGTTAGDLVGEA